MGKKFVTNTGVTVTTSDTVASTVGFKPVSDAKPVEKKTAPAKGAKKTE